LTFTLKSPLVCPRSYSLMWSASPAGSTEERK